MAVSEDRKYEGEYVYNLLESILGKTLGEIDTSGQFIKAAKSPKITGIAGNVIEQSVFKYAADNKQECDIEIDGVLTELKTTGVRIPKKDLPLVKNKSRNGYSSHYLAKEGISITGVTLEPYIQLDFETSHFWKKSQRLLIVFYEYNRYDVAPASEYAAFPVVGYCYNTFSNSEKSQLKNDWEIVRDFLQPIYLSYDSQEARNQELIGFTHKLRPHLLLIELVPGFKQKSNGSFQRPRYRLKKTFVDYLVKGHFSNSRKEHEIELSKSFNSFEELDQICKDLTSENKGKTFLQLKEKFKLKEEINSKDFGALCIIHMFGAHCKKLNQISSFTKAGIIAKTITISSKDTGTEDMKLAQIDFDEWSDRDIDFENSEIYNYFSEHSFLCPIFREYDVKDDSKTTFEGFKRFAFDDDFIYSEVKKTWMEVRGLIHRNELVWEYNYDKERNPIKNKSGSYKGAPNFPKSKTNKVFIRGGANDSSERSRTEVVNGIKMVPQFFWLYKKYIVDKLNTLPFI